MAGTGEREVCFFNEKASLKEKAPDAPAGIPSSESRTPRFFPLAAAGILSSSGSVSSRSMPFFFNQNLSLKEEGYAPSSLSTCMPFFFNQNSSLKEKKKTHT